MAYDVAVQISTKIKQSMAVYLNNDTSGVLDSAAKCLQVSLCGLAQEIFAIDISYH